MGRPTARPKSEISAAITRLREHLGETQYEFAARLRVSPVTLARYETCREPKGAILERLHRLAVKHYVTAAPVFRLALDNEKEQRGLRLRMGQILDPLNVKEAGDLLRELVETIRRTRETILGTLSIDGVDQQALIDIQAAEEEALRMADLLCIDGRKELLEEK
jgi:transcriptional regulator with XRE-family HTH domain